MKRRSFLQAIGGAVAAAFAPAVAGKDELDSSYLSEAALEDIIIEINEFQSATGQRIFMSAPTKLFPL